VMREQMVREATSPTPSSSRSAVARTRTGGTVPVWRRRSSSPWRRGWLSTSSGRPATGRRRRRTRHGRLPTHACATG
jgi:hypothetical protein